MTPEVIAFELDSAREYMSRVGWTTDRMRDPITGGVCCAGALLHWRGRPKSVDEIMSEAWAIRALTKFIGHHVPLWNDKICKGLEEALGAFAGCASWVRSPEFDLSVDEGLVPGFLFSGTVTVYYASPNLKKEEKGKELKALKVLLDVWASVPDAGIETSEDPYAEVPKALAPRDPYTDVPKAPLSRASPEVALA